LARTIDRHLAQIVPLADILQPYQCIRNKYYSTLASSRVAQTHLWCTPAFRDISSSLRYLELHSHRNRRRASFAKLFTFGPASTRSAR